MVHQLEVFTDKFPMEKIFTDKFPIEKIDPTDKVQFFQLELFDYLKDPSFDGIDTAIWARYKFCLIHRYGFFYERPKKISEIASLLFYQINNHTRTRVRSMLRTGLSKFRKKLNEGKHPFDVCFPTRLHNMGMIYDISPRLFEFYYEKVNKYKEW